MLVKTILAASITAVALTAAPYAVASSAAPSNAKEKVLFSYNTAELTTYSGAEVVYERMVEEAKEACSDNSTRPIRVKKLKERCQDELIASWVEKIDNERLNKVYAAAQNEKEYAAAD